MASPSDRTFSLIRETTPGVLPSTGTLLPLDYIPGTMPSFQSDMLTSPTLSASRASQGARRTAFRVEGGFRLHFCRDSAVETLLESALSGTWATNTLRAGATDTHISIEQRLIEGAGSLYQRFLGCQVSGFTLDCTYDGIAEASFDIIGMTRQTATTASSLTYAAVGTKPKLAGLDVSSVTIAGLAGVEYVSLSLAVRHNREVQGQFGSASPRGIGTSGFRSVTLSLKFYRENFNPETVIGDTGLNVQFTIGAGVNGYTIRLPRAIGSLPVDEDEGSKSLVSVDFTAAYDATEQTDLIITRLT